MLMASECIGSIPQRALPNDRPASTVVGIASLGQGGVDHPLAKQLQTTGATSYPCRIHAARDWLAYAGADPGWSEPNPAPAIESASGGDSPAAWHALDQGLAGGGIIRSPSWMRD